MRKRSDELAETYHSSQWPSVVGFKLYQFVASVAGGWGQNATEGVVSALYGVYSLRQAPCHTCHVRREEVLTAGAKAGSEALAIASQLGRFWFA